MVQFRKTLIFHIDLNDLMHLRGQLGVTLGSIFMQIKEDNSPKVKNGPPKRHIDIECHLSCISYRLVSDPKGPKSRIYPFLRKILKGQEGHEDARKNNDQVSRGTFGHFGVIRGSRLDIVETLLYDLGYMRVTLESLWSNFGNHSFAQ